MFFADSGPAARNCSRALDFAPPTGDFGPVYTDRKLIVLCMTPRSGSSHLGSLMTANGLGSGGEHFSLVNPDRMREALEPGGPITYDRYLRHLIESRTQNDVFCVKTDWQQYMPVYYFGAHQHYFAEASFVYLTRGDVLMQAISRYVASETRYFHSTNVKTAHTLNDDVPFDFDKISRHLQTLIDMQSAWEWFFACEGIRPLRISYEDIEQDEASVITRIAAHVHLPLNGEASTESAYTVVRNERNDRLREQFVARAKQIRDSDGSALVARLRESSAN